MKGFFYLLNMKLSGVKNIEKEISVEFYKKTIEKDFSPRGYNVKAIYGENGSGKTAIVSAVDLFRKILIEEDFLNSLSNQMYLDEIINKKTKRFTFTCELLHHSSPDKDVYIYSITIAKSESDKYIIEHESLSARSRTGSIQRTIFECRNGEILHITCDDNTAEIIKVKFANLLPTKTFIMNAFANRNMINDMKIMGPVTCILVFGFSIYTYVDRNDQHDLYFLSKTLKELKNDESKLGSLFFGVIDNIDRFTGVRTHTVNKTDYARYEKKVKMLESFLKLFKSDLQTISIERKVDKDIYECSLIMNYTDYSVDREFESTGIKRLIDLFDYLNYAAEGQIVFIDEMDANINDIYLCKLVEFFMEYGEGQLCFTTHNTSPMSILKHNRKSIDFLSNDNRIIPWTTNGNYSPENLYRTGMIKYLPFNVESIDFIGILGGEND